MNREEKLGLEKVNSRLSSFTSSWSHVDLKCGDSPAISLVQKVDKAKHEDAVDGVCACEARGRLGPCQELLECLQRNTHSKIVENETEIIYKGKFTVLSSFFLFIE